MTDLAQLLGSHPLVTGGAVLALAGYLISVAKDMPGKVWSELRKRVVTSVEIHEWDVTFQWLENWLAAHPGAYRTRAFCLRTDTLGDSPAGLGEIRSYRSVDREYRFRLAPAEGHYFLRFLGRRIWVSRERRWFDSAPNGRAYQDTVTLTTFGSRFLLEQLLNEVREFSTSADPGIELLWAAGGRWGHQGYRARRSGESIFLPHGQFDSLVRDIDAFYGSENWYRDRGIPWQRGYLFSGAPGTGKTSAIVGLASELGLDIACASLSSSEMSDQSLRLLMSALPDRTLFVIEDVDALFETRKTSCRVTFAGLLNALDGIAASDGRVLIMTTNHPEKLDPALIRPGRVDRRIEFRNANQAIAAEMFLWFFRDRTELGVTYLAQEFAEQLQGRDDVSPAMIQEHLLRHRDSPGDAAAASIDCRLPGPVALAEAS
jgi:mitochondrial chaperone BCS1